MKKLILVRHSKAVDETDSIQDFHRHLTSEGKQLAKVVAEKVCAKFIEETQIISSTATRAIDTARIFAAVMKFPAERIAQTDFLYQYFNFQQFFEYMGETFEAYDSVMMFGHNPMFSTLADSLSEKRFNSLPKSAACGFEFGVQTWKEIAPRTGRLLFYENPKKYS